MSDVEAEFDKIDKLLGLTPFFRCPKCGKRDEDGTGSPTFFMIRMPVVLEMEVEDTRKELIIDLSSIGVNDALASDMTMICNDCQHEFPLPVGWTYRYR